MTDVSSFCKRRRFTGPTPCLWPDCECEAEFEKRIECRKEETLLPLWATYPKLMAFLIAIAFLMAFGGLIYLLTVTADWLNPSKLGR